MIKIGNDVILDFVQQDMEYIITEEQYTNAALFRGLNTFDAITWTPSGIK